MQDPEFLDRGKRISDDLRPMSSADAASLIRQLAGLPPPALDYLAGMLRKQGLEPQ